MTLLFDELVRNDMRPAHQSEQTYPYLNLSGRAPAELIRNTLETWFAKYPDEHKSSLKQNFVNQADESAFSELLIHETLIQLGAKDISIHPSIAGSEKTPDFRAVAGCTGVYLEVKNSMDSENPRIQQFCDGLNEKYRTKGYMLDISFEGEFASAIPVRRFMNFVDKMSENLNLADLLKDGNYNDIPAWVFPHNDNRIHIRPIPCRDPEMLYERPIGMHGPHGARILDHTTRLRNSLKKKATRYGKLDLPYIIVINFEDSSLHDIDTAQALFGDEVFIGTVQKEDLEFSRKNNGLWSENSNTRVSGVVIMDQTNPWSFWRITPVLWVNPYAKKPLDKTLFEGRIEVRDVNTSTGDIGKSDGKNFADLLGIDSNHWSETFND